MCALCDCMQLEPAAWMWELSSQSEAAKAVVQPTHVPTDPAPSQASQPPQGICVRCAIACRSNLLLGCGSSRARARQRWRWLSQPMYQLTLRHRRKASPHLRLEMHSPVGAGLLAKAVVQSTYLSTDTPPSQASQLPQGTCVHCAIACSSNLLHGCGSSRTRARQRRRWLSQPIYQLTPRHHRQASPHLRLEMHSPVGAGLPAKAVGQTAHLSTDIPHRQTNPYRRSTLSCHLIGGSAARRIPYGASTGTGQTGRTW